MTAHGESGSKRAVVGRLSGSICPTVPSSLTESRRSATAASARSVASSVCTIEGSHGRSPVSVTATSSTWAAPRINRLAAGGRHLAPCALVEPPACYPESMAFVADVVVMARDVPDVLLIAEVKRTIGDIGTAEAQLRQYMLARRCSLGLLVTPEHTRIYRDTFANFTEGSVQLVGEFSTAEVLNVDIAPPDERGLREAVREWLDRMAASWPSALPRTDAARAPVVQYLVPEVADGRVSSGSLG